MAPARRNLLLIGAVGAASAAAGLILGPLVRPSDSDSDSLRKAVFTDLTGAPRRISQWDGQVRVCNFWATWCAPCREEMPMLAGLHRKFSAKGVQIIGIGIDQAHKIAEFASSLKIPYPLLRTDPGSLALMKQLGNSSGGLPYTVILDRVGTIRGRRLGVYGRAELEAALVELSME